MTRRTLHVASATPQTGETMSGYGINDVPHVELNDEAMASLGEENADQAALMAEAVIPSIRERYRYWPNFKT